MQKYLAEIFGTFCLVLLGCGSAVLAGGQIGMLGVALAFGFALLILVYMVGPISGCHLNPAVTLTLAALKKFDYKEVVPYIVSQCVGAILAGFVLLHIAEGKGDFSLMHGFACNGFGAHSPAGHTMISCFIAEAVMTFILLRAVLATTRNDFPIGFAGIFLGITLAVIHMMSIPVTNTSVNFARSLGVAVVHGGWAMQQLWLFAAAQFVAVVAAVGSYKACNCVK